MFTFNVDEIVSELRDTFQKTKIFRNLQKLCQSVRTISRNFRNYCRNHSFSRMNNSIRLLSAHAVDDFPVPGDVLEDQLPFDGPRPDLLSHGILVMLEVVDAAMQLIDVVFEPMFIPLFCLTVG